MPHAVTHILIALILFDFWRDHIVKNKKKFPIHYVLIGGIAGLLPDMDVFVYWLFSFSGFTLSQVHRTFSHTLFAPALFVLLGFLVIKVKAKRLGKHHLKLSNIFFVIAAGIAIHLLLDATISGFIMPFYPLNNFGLGLNLVGKLPNTFSASALPALDAILLVMWLWHEEKTHKISDFF